MPRSISVNKKSARGRPKKVGGVDPVSAVRLPADVTARVDKWGEANGIGRSEAIRRLVELGLGKPSKQSGPTSTASSIDSASDPTRGRKSRARAAELAANVVGQKVDPNASPEEKAERKRKLIKGPSIFRDIRKDRP